MVQKLSSQESPSRFLKRNQKGSPKKKTILVLPLHRGVNREGYNFKWPWSNCVPFDPSWILKWVFRPHCHLRPSIIWPMEKTSTPRKGIIIIFKQNFDMTYRLYGRVLCPKWLFLVKNCIFFSHLAVVGVCKTHQIFL